MHIQETWSTPLTKCHIWAGHFLKWLISHVNEHFHMRNLPFQMWMQFPFLTFEFLHVETKHDTWKHVKFTRGVKVILIGYFHMKSNFNMPKENSHMWMNISTWEIYCTFSNVNVNAFFNMWIKISTCGHKHDVWNHMKFICEEAHFHTFDWLFSHIQILTCQKKIMSRVNWTFSQVTSHVNENLHVKFTFSNVNYIHSYVIAFEHVRSNFNMSKNVMWTGHFLMWLIFYIIYIHVTFFFLPRVN